MAFMDFGGVQEEVVTREEMPLARARQILKNEVVGILGYGPQGQGQGMNLRDNGIKVIIGQRKGGRGWKDAIADGWKEGKNLFETIEEVASRATMIEYLLSDAGQKEQWPKLAACLRPGQALCFSHGFSVVFRDQTGVVPPADGGCRARGAEGCRADRPRELPRRQWHQFQLRRPSGCYRAVPASACIALGIAIGSGYLFPTTFENEVYSDLTG